MPIFEQYGRQRVLSLELMHNNKPAMKHIMKRHPNLALAQQKTRNILLLMVILELSSISTIAEIRTLTGT